MINRSPSRLPRACLTLWLIGISLAGQLAFSAEEAAANPDTGKVFGNVWRLRGEVFASGKLGVPRKLREGSPVYVGEQVRATSTGEAVLKTTDAGVVAVRPGAEFVPERYAAEGKSTDRQILRLISGSLRIISGWIGQLNRAEHRVITPSATIGIRGTDHEPYVLPAEKATTTYRQGTYDKVNRGATSLEANGGNILIEPGRVGFARDPKAGDVRTRALMTVLLPTLLARVPDFYVPGSFDTELDNYAENSGAVIEKLLENRNIGKRPPSAAAPAVAAAPAAAGQEAPAPLVAPTGCDPRAVGEYWLARFDRAIAGRDVKTILGLFGPEIVARATVRSADGSTRTIEFNRDELVQSTLSSVASLKNYQQRRLTLDTTATGNASPSACQPVEVKTDVIEQGLMNDKPYRFESTEVYLLEQRAGEWLATRADTTQR